MPPDQIEIFNLNILSKTRKEDVKMKRILFCFLLFILLGCQNSTEENYNIIGRWETDIEGYTEYSENGDFYAEYDERITTGNYTAYYGEDAYQVLIKEDNPNRIQKTLLDTIIASDENYSIENLVAIEIIVKDFTYKGVSMLNNEDWIIETESLGLGFLLEDSTKHCKANIGFDKTIEDEDFWSCYTRKEQFS